MTYWYVTAWMTRVGEEMLTSYLRVTHVCKSVLLALIRAKGQSNIMYMLQGHCYLSTTLHMLQGQLFFCFWLQRTMSSVVFYITIFVVSQVLQHSQLYCVQESSQWHSKKIKMIVQHSSTGISKLICNDINFCSSFKTYMTVYLL